jgi:hypothetical protein
MAQSCQLWERILASLTFRSVSARWMSLCTAMQSGLGVNETLESLEISNALLDADNAELWCRAFSFLRANTCTCWRIRHCATEAPRR